MNDDSSSVKIGETEAVSCPIANSSVSAKINVILDERPIDVEVNCLKNMLSALINVSIVEPVKLLILY